MFVGSLSFNATPNTLYRRAGRVLLSPAIVPGRNDRQSISRGCRRVDVCRLVVVNRDAEHLSELRGAEGEGLGRADKLRLHRSVHVMQIDDAQRRTIEIDECLFAGIGSRSE